MKWWFAAYLWVLGGAFSGCQDQVAFVDAHRIVPPELAARQMVPLAAQDSTTLFLNFEGATLTQAQASDAWTNRTFLCGATIPPFDHAPYGEDRAAVINAVADKVQALFSQIPLQVVTQRPALPPYDMAVVGGTATQCGLAAGMAGIGPVDCGNALQGEIALVFSETITHLDMLAVVIAHETAHSYGLVHTTEPCDLMSNSFCTSGGKTFLDQDMTVAPDQQGQCGLTVQNSWQLLSQHLGGTPAEAPDGGGEGPAADGAWGGPELGAGQDGSHRPDADGDPVEGLDATAPEAGDGAVAESAGNDGGGCSLAQQPGFSLAPLLVLFLLLGLRKPQGKKPSKPSAWPGVVQDRWG